MQPATPVSPAPRPPQGHADIARSARALVLKSGVHLGVLSESQRQLALGLVWRSLPQTTWNEPGMNTALRSVLDGCCAFLAADHVELRRWLVDTGWVQRDGWGRAYRCQPAADLPAALQPLADWLLSHDVPTWARALQNEAAAAREARRAAWLTRTGTPGTAV
jgi:hypothetical protein